MQRLFLPLSSFVAAAAVAVADIDFSQWESSIGVRSKSQKEMNGNLNWICIIQILTCCHRTSINRQRKQTKRRKKHSANGTGWHRMKKREREENNIRTSHSSSKSCRLTPFTQSKFRTYSNTPKWTKKCAPNTQLLIPSNMVSHKITLNAHWICIAH